MSRRRGPFGRAVVRQYSVSTPRSRGQGPERAGRPRRIRYPARHEHGVRTDGIEARAPAAAERRPRRVPPRIGGGLRSRARRLLLRRAAGRACSWGGTGLSPRSRRCRTPRPLAGIWLHASRERAIPQPATGGRRHHARRPSESGEVPTTLKAGRRGHGHHPARSALAVNREPVQATRLSDRALAPLDERRQAFPLREPRLSRAPPPAATRVRPGSFRRHATQR